MFPILQYSPLASLVIIDYTISSYACVAMSKFKQL